MVYISLKSSTLVGNKTSDSSLFTQLFEIEPLDKRSQIRIQSLTLRNQGSLLGQLSGPLPPQTSDAFPKAIASDELGAQCLRVRLTRHSGVTLFLVQEVKVLFS